MSYVTRSYVIRVSVSSPTRNNPGGEIILGVKKSLTSPLAQAQFSTPCVTHSVQPSPFNSKLFNCAKSIYGLSN